MTTLSKEVIESVADKYDFSEFSSEFKTSIEELYKFVAELELLVRADLVAENERLTDSNQMYLDRIEYLERKYRCHNEYAKRPILYTDGVDGEQCCRDDLWAVSTAELSAMTDQLTAARTALAAAEAREGKLRAAIDVVLSDAEECEDHDGWLANLVSCEAIHQLDEAFSQPRDDSALREMIAEVYEECAKVCEAMNYINTQPHHCADAIRALAEKAKGE